MNASRLLKVTPVRQYPDPRYPLRSVVDIHPELLRRVPKRWRGNPVVIGALASVASLLSSYGNPDDGTKGKSTVSAVAPIFHHGEGRASYGCIVVNPPVFLTEYEARQVIEEEARKWGIHFECQEEILPDVQTTSTILMGGDPLDLKTVKRAVVLDGTDYWHRVSYEFMSRSDYRQWADPRDFYGTVEVLNAVEASEKLRGKLQDAHAPGYYAVFYEPFERPPEVQSSASDKSATQTLRVSMSSWERGRETARERAHEDLRAQVRDFIQWLKGQGVI